MLHQLEKLGGLKKTFSFLNSSWAALKYFDEQQFLQLVQGQQLYNTNGVIGRLPRLLTFASLEQQQTMSISRSSTIRSSVTSTTQAWYENNSSRFGSTMSVHSSSTSGSADSCTSSSSQSRSNSNSSSVTVSPRQSLKPDDLDDRPSILDSPALQQFISDHFTYQHSVGSAASSMTSRHSSDAKRHYHQRQQRTMNVNSEA